ncbi:MAG TPA: hypothetical protein DIW64_11615 [Cellvibrio sp.]|nr:hypothetical protein [Cellvibrio sp.]
MNHYVFFINLGTDDCNPPYQILGCENHDEKSASELRLFAYPPSLMPKIFDANDKITFIASGKNLVECTLYLRPLNEASCGAIPFENPTGYDSEKAVNEILIFKAENYINQTLTIKDNVGDWDFSIAGTFSAVCAYSFDKEKLIELKNPLTKKLLITLPFLIDPEIVVGRRPK